MNAEILTTIAADMELANLVIAFGSPANKRKAKAHLKVCNAAINKLDPVDPAIAAMSDDELLAELAVD